jgi:iron complex outermembrane receptor protein
MRRKLTLTLLGAASFTSLIYGLPAAAQIAPAPARPAAADLAEVIVTARRREEAVQDIPLAVQAFDAATLSERRVENAVDLSKLVPALTSAQSSRDEENYVIRGMSGSGASISGQQVTVPTYLSQVPLPIGDGGGPGRYFDLQNIQVLKGPQGTLFGRNSTGGAVLFEPRRPDDTFGGYVEGEVGNYDLRGVAAAVNLPLGKTLAVRVAMKANEREGFTKNIVTGQDQDNRSYISGRVSVLWQPTEHLSNLLVADVYNSHTNGSSNHLTAVNPNAPLIIGLRLLNPPQDVVAALALQNSLGPYKAISSVRGLDKIEAYGLANITTWEVGEGVTLKNIFGYRVVRQVNRFDYDGTSISLLDFDTCMNAASCRTMSPDHPWGLNVRQYTNETQAQGKLFGDALDYTVGVFGAQTDTPDANYNHQTSVFGSTTDLNQFIKDTSYAAYGQGSYDLSSLVDGLKVTAGYRRTKDRRSLQIYQVGSFSCVTGQTGAPAPNPANAPQCQAYFESKATSDSYTIGLDYRINERALVYVTHRKSYRAGGTNPLAGPVLLATPPIPNAQSLFTYEPEQLKDVEVGLKADWRIGEAALRTNLALYKQRLDNAQLNQTFAVGTRSVSALVNAAEANVKGAEFDAQLAPGHGLEITFNYAYTKAKYGAFLDYSRRDPITNAPTLQDGRIFPFTPRHKGNLGVRYLLPVPDQWGEVSASVNWAFKSKIILGLVPFITLPGNVNVPDGESVQKATDTVDLSVDWKRIGGRAVDASFFVTNLTDEVYKIGGASLINSGLAVNQRIYNEPRMFGVRLHYAFGVD